MIYHGGLISQKYGVPKNEANSVRNANMAASKPGFAYCAGGVAGAAAAGAAFALCMW